MKNIWKEYVWECKCQNHDLPEKPSYEMAKNFLVTKINFVLIFSQLSLSLIFTSADTKCVAENMFRVYGSTQFL